MLPLSLLRTSVRSPILIELKNGETYNGQLDSCDNFMNIHLKDAICTSRDGDRFWKTNECYIRGSFIKYLRIPTEVLDLVREDATNAGHTGKGGKLGGANKKRAGATRGRGNGGANRPRRPQKTN